VSADVHALSGAYALDALDDDERSTFVAHLVECATCREEVAELQATAAALGAAVAEAPPSAARARVLAAADVTRQDTGRAGVAEPARRPRGAGWLPAVAAAAALVVAGLAGHVARLDARNNELTARAAQLASILAADDLTTLPLDGDGARAARLLVAPSRDSVMLVADRMDAIASDRSYELWFIGDDGAAPAGLFRPGADGRVVHLVPGDLSGVAAVGVTVEPRAGSATPTTEPVLIAHLRN
jgi:anti-sigma-K factor RskA